MPELEISLCDPWLVPKEPDPPPPEGVSVDYFPWQLSLDAPNAVESIVIGLTTNVSASALITLGVWLFHVLAKHGAKHITVDQSEEVEVTPTEIQRVVRDKIGGRTRLI